MDVLKKDESAIEMEIGNPPKSRNFFSRFGYYLWTSLDIRVILNWHNGHS
jgi:hypothetical protein